MKNLVVFVETDTDEMNVALGVSKERARELFVIAVMHVFFPGAYTNLSGQPHCAVKETCAIIGELNPNEIILFAHGCGMAQCYRGGLESRNPFDQMVFQKHCQGILEEVRSYTPEALKPRYQHVYDMADNQGSEETETDDDQ